MKAKKNLALHIFDFKTQLDEIKDLDELVAFLEDTTEYFKDLSAAKGKFSGKIKNGFLEFKVPGHKIEEDDDNLCSICYQL